MSKVKVDLDAARDTARAVSAHIVAEQLRCGYRVRKPRDPGSVYVNPALRYLLTAADLGLIQVADACE